MLCCLLRVWHCRSSSHSKHSVQRAQQMRLLQVKAQACTEMVKCHDGLHASTSARLPAAGGGGHDGEQGQQASHRVHAAGGGSCREVLGCAPEVQVRGHTDSASLVRSRVGAFDRPHDQDLRPA